MSVTCAQCSIALTDSHRNERGNFHVCALCKERRVPKPASYCGTSCARQHWKQGHKAFHEAMQEKAAEMTHNSQGVQAGDTDFNAKYMSLCQQSEQARLSGNFRNAEKLAAKAIAIGKNSKLYPGVDFLPLAHYCMGMAFSRAGDDDNAAPHLQRAVELSDTGSLIRKQFAFSTDAQEQVWAKAMTQLFGCFMSSSTVPRPAWFGDVEQGKRLANRAVAALPDSGPALQMRASVYEKWGEPSAADLRQALRDRQRVLEQCPAGGSGVTTQRRAVDRLDSKLRARIAADVAAARSVAPPSAAAAASPSRPKKDVLDYAKWDKLALDSDSD